MKNLMRKIKLKAILPAAAFIAAAAIGTTFAWQTWDLEAKNILKSHETKVEVKEDFPHDNKGTKIVQFENKGSSSVFLRVSYTEFWEKTKEDGNTYLLSNVKNDGQEIAHIVWSPTSWNGEASEWLDGGDGWYYYKKILKAAGGDDSITAPVVTQVTFADIPDEYKDAEYRLYFKVEAVQCSDGNNTLNSDEVNKDATWKLFNKMAKVKENGEVDWGEEEGGE